MSFRTLSQLILISKILPQIGTSMIKDDLQEHLEWITYFKTDLSGTRQENILPGTYMSLTPPADIDLARIYGSKYQTLLTLKREYDPQNVFSLAVPRI
jgi:hypothetical protein